LADRRENRPGSAGSRADTGNGVASGFSGELQPASGSVPPPQVKLLAALLSSLSLAEEHGGAENALEASGVKIDDAGRVRIVAERMTSLLSAEAVGDPMREALALGFLAGRVAHGPRSRRPRDPSSFLMDRDLLVQAAEGESVMRLPWFEEDLFVGRQLPDITEMPSQVREMATENYLAALTGERRSYAFTSYGHSYKVEAVPILDEHKTAVAVLAVATPALRSEPSPGAFEQTVARFERSAMGAEKLAERHAGAGRHADEQAARHAAEKARPARTGCGRRRASCATAADVCPRSPSVRSTSCSLPPTV
jgi:hypothetical protein